MTQVAIDIQTYFVSCTSGITALKALGSIGKSGAELVNSVSDGTLLIMEIRCTESVASAIYDGYRDGILVYDMEGVRVP